MAANSSSRKTNAEGSDMMDKDGEYSKQREGVQSSGATRGVVNANEKSGQHSWDFEKLIELPALVKAPGLYCCKDDHTLIIGDALGGAVYAIDLITEDAKEIYLQGRIMSCAYMTDGTLVVGEFDSGRIAVYDSQGTHVRDIPLFEEPLTKNVALTVDNNNGVIIAASVCGGKNVVHFVDPKNGETVKKGAVDAKEIRGEINVTSLGLVVVKTNDDEFTIIDGDNAHVRSKIKRPEWHEVRCAVDPIDDTLYVCYISDINAKSAVAVIDEVSIGGQVKKKAALEFKQYTRPVIAPIVTPKGQLVVCNGKEILVYKKVYTRGVKASSHANRWLKV